MHWFRPVVPLHTLSIRGAESGGYSIFYGPPEGPESLLIGPVRYPSSIYGLTLEALQTLQKHHPGATIRVFDEANVGIVAVEHRQQNVQKMFRRAIDTVH